MFTKRPHEEGKVFDVFTREGRRKTGETEDVGYTFRFVCSIFTNRIKGKTEDVGVGAEKFRRKEIGRGQKVYTRQKKRKF